MTRDLQTLYRLNPAEKLTKPPFDESRALESALAFLEESYVEHIKSCLQQADEV
jgi:hypothetical protein